MSYHAYQLDTRFGKAAEHIKTIEAICGKKIIHDLPSAEPPPEERLLQQERRQALERALTALPQRDRLLFYRKYYYRQSTAQIAAELGTTERAVEGRLYRIKKALRKALGGDDA